MSFTTTAAPEAANANAIARPVSAPAPVTIAACPLKLTEKLIRSLAANPVRCSSRQNGTSPSGCQSTYGWHRAQHNTMNRVYRLHYGHRLPLYQTSARDSNHAAPSGSTPAIEWRVWLFRPAYWSLAPRHAASATVRTN